jgi:uncharacterized repeat protein (TIGR03803 family)
MLDPAGNETILHSFSGPDGIQPLGGLVRDSANNLYGTTWIGGDFGEGTIFKLDSFGNFSLLYSFSGPDGAQPTSNVIRDSDGNLYGTTTVGGA